MWPITWDEHKERRAGSSSLSSPSNSPARLSSCPSLQLPTTKMSSHTSSFRTRRTFLKTEFSVGFRAVGRSRAGVSRATKTGTHRLLQALTNCEVLPRPSWRILVDPSILRSLLCGIILALIHFAMD
jgi:hypothetical protein